MSIGYFLFIAFLSAVVTAIVLNAAINIALRRRTMYDDENGNELS